MKTIELGSERGPTVLLLHGAGLGWWCFRQAALLLRDRCHLVLPLVPGHADSGSAFTSIESCAAQLITMIDRRFGGSVAAIAGLSLGGQIAGEILAQRGDICRCALLESAAVIPAPLSRSLLRPGLALSYGLIRREWFSRRQFQALGLPPELFDDYYRDTRRLRREDLLAMLQASLSYSCRPELARVEARTLIVAGGRESRRVLASARLLHETIPDSQLRIIDGYGHGELSIKRAGEYAAILTQFIPARP